jgi:hypothetical protein
MRQDDRVSEPPYIRTADGVVREGEKVPPEEMPPLGLDGAELTFIRVDHQTRMQFNATEIVVETPFRLFVDGQEHELDPEDRADLGPLIAIYPATLRAAIVTPGLTLRLTFSSGALMEVPQHAQYEAWQVVGPGSRLIVCPPGAGGRLAVWL